MVHAANISMMWLFALVETNAPSLGDTLARTLPLWLWIVVPAVVVYACGSALVERNRKVLGVVGYIVVMFVFATKLAVTGAYGPAHAAFESGKWAWPALGAVLVVKAGVIEVRGWFASGA